ncbi:hypothetical protein LJC17_01115 [Acholeplasma sp. OttesenSCG-928-E16]|nr:hypothetical protein [Acholeplasma sp. OttesenSCG-928-E16]
MKKLLLIITFLLAIPLFGCDNNSEYSNFAGTYRLKSVFLDEVETVKEEVFDYFEIDLYANKKMSIRSKGADDSSSHKVAFNYDGTYEIKGEEISFLTKKYQIIEKHTIKIEYDANDNIKSIMIYLDISKNIEQNILYDYSLILELKK